MAADLATTSLLLTQAGPRCSYRRQGEPDGLSVRFSQRFV